MRFYSPTSIFFSVKIYFIDYLGFRSREPLAFTLTVVNGLSPSIIMENAAFPDLDINKHDVILFFFPYRYYLTNYFKINPTKPVTFDTHISKILDMPVH